MNTRRKAVERRSGDTDLPAGDALTLFAIGFFAGVAYLWLEYGHFDVLLSLSDTGRLWAALFCAQTGAWAMVGVLSVRAVLRTRTAIPLRKALPATRLAGLVAALLSVALVTLSSFVVFLGPEAMSVRLGIRQPGIESTIGGLGLIGAPLSYVVLTIVTGSILLTHSALQFRCSNPLDASEQIRELIRFQRMLSGAHGAS